ncbi:ABC-type oligopeptide transporter ABCB9-like [Protopterus annectens]|uniref:ABC-type oligopeptide transporter ABCB9-like n=1 Tax=Protopterus annectens TaxID=7888 RepID=UPI001CFBAB7B|nr:ABC-type oligopeptide transporter ABCB9-like [Protopterus annectens]XP_043939236.1 ABC-type oligopeptide transporter ABCB9-like [Protopterus annectens]XP_043939237.1 ABC-type oligopeptide transporter ABCB9-like [Protopterus annectens]
MKMLALFFFPLLDFAMIKLSQALHFELYHVLLGFGLIELAQALYLDMNLSLVAIWVASFIRFGFLVASAHLILHRITKKPSSWLNSKMIVKNVGVLCFLPPLYVSVTSVLGFPATEVQCRSWSLTVIVMTYVIAVLVYFIWEHFLPFQGHSEINKLWESVKQLLSFVRPDLWRLIMSCFFLFLTTLGEMAIPYYTGRMTDWIANKDDPSAFFNAVMTMSLLTIGSAVTAFICYYLYSVNMCKIQGRMQRQAFKSVMYQEVAFFDRSHTGDVTSHISTDTNTVTEALSQELNSALWNSLRAVFLFAFMLGLSSKLSVFTLIGLPIIIAISALSAKCHQKLAAEVQDSLAKANDVATETFSSIKTVRSFANEDGEAERYSKKLQDVYQLKNKEASVFGGHMCISNLTGLAMKVSVLYYGGRLVTHGDVSSGDLVAFILYELQFAQAMQALFSVYPSVWKAIGASEKIFDYMDKTPKVSRPGTLAPETLTGHIEFKNVSFSYPNRMDTPVLKNISFELKPGEITALVGPSGGGKSTCVYLLERFYEPVSGEILLDGRPVNEYEHKYFHRKMALVSQEPQLFARSVEENIAYGLKKTSSDDIILASKQANAHTFISALKDQYQTDAGDKGGQLSGGQKQRIAIARALLRDPKILILDDATSSLDTESEHMVQKALYNGKQKQTILVIAHRLSTVEMVDKIIVLDKGEVVEHGTHRALLEKKGKYFQLVQIQHGAFENSEIVEPYALRTES